MQKLTNKELAAMKSSLHDRIRSIKELTKAKPQKAITSFKESPGCLLVFNSRAHLETWTFLASTGLPWNIWTAEYCNLWNRDFDISHIAEPDRVMLNYNYDVDNDKLADLILKSSNGCRLCWGKGFAYSPITFVLRDTIPGKLKVRPCPCQARAV